MPNAVQTAVCTPIDPRTGKVGKTETEITPKKNGSDKGQYTSFECRSVLFVDIIYIVASKLAEKAQASSMAIQLYSLNHAPKTLPIWDLIMEDLGWPSPHRVAKALGVGESTVYRWNSTGRVPRAAHLALFWLTRWGRSTISVQATTDALVACGYVSSLKAEIRRLERNVQYLAALSSGAANDPLTRLPAAQTRQPGQAQLGGPQ